MLYQVLDLQSMPIEGEKFCRGKVVLTNSTVGFRDHPMSFDLVKFVTDSLRRHVQGDWGDVCEDDKGRNDQDLIDGNRLFSVYKYPYEEGQAKIEIDGAWSKETLEKIWIITERDRSVTTILLPSEY